MTQLSQKALLKGHSPEPCCGCGNPWVAEECSVGTLASPQVPRLPAALVLCSVLASPRLGRPHPSVCVCKVGRRAILGFFLLFKLFSQSQFFFHICFLPPSISLALSVEKYLKICNSLESPHQEFEGVPQERGSWRVCTVWVLLPEAIAPSCEVRLAFTIPHRAVTD